MKDQPLALSEEEEGAMGEIIDGNKERGSPRSDYTKTLIENGRC